MITLEEWVHGLIREEIRRRGIDREAEARLSAEQWNQICQAAGVPPPTAEFIERQQRKKPAQK